jgi:hypothetical protein
MREQQVQRSRNAVEVERLDHQRRVSDLPGTASEEAPKLSLDRSVVPLRLLLEGSERRELSARLEHRLDAGGAERPDQLALEIGLADEEAERLEVLARAGRPDAPALERPSEWHKLANVAKTRRSHAVREIAQEPADRVGSSDRQDLHILGGEVAPEPTRERLDRSLVARAFDEYDPACVRDDVHLGVFYRAEYTSRHAPECVCDLFLAVVSHARMLRDPPDHRSARRCGLTVRGKGTNNRGFATP